MTPYVIDPSDTKTLPRGNKRMISISLRTLIHDGEKAARTARDLTEERERALAAEACVALWAVFDVGHPKTMRRFVSCVRRLAQISWDRWAVLLIAVEKIFHNSLDPVANPS